MKLDLRFLCISLLAMSMCCLSLVQAEFKVNGAPVDAPESQRAIEPANSQETQKRVVCKAWNIRTFRATMRRYGVTRIPGLRIIKASPSLVKLLLSKPNNRYIQRVRRLPKPRLSKPKGYFVLARYTDPCPKMEIPLYQLADAEGRLAFVIPVVGCQRQACQYGLFHDLIIGRCEEVNVAMLLYVKSKANCTMVSVEVNKPVACCCKTFNHFRYGFKL